MSAEPKKYIDEYSDLLGSLSNRGFRLINYSQEPTAFDNFCADFSDGKTSFRIIRDRSQLFLEGKKAELEPHGLWQAFDDRSDFEKALLNWIAKKV